MQGFTESAQDTIPLIVVKADLFNDWQNELPPFDKSWLQSSGFKGVADNHCFIPDLKGQLKSVIACVKSFDDFWGIAHLPRLLPVGNYRLEGLPNNQLFNAALSWGLGCYQFTRFKSSEKTIEAKLLLSPELDKLKLVAMGDAIYLIRDLINTPADHLGPLELAVHCQEYFSALGAQVSFVKGDDLLTQHFPAIHAVGRACDDPPCLIDIRWGDPTHPKLTLVGKGVCFDSGGLDLKSAAAMSLMKKDMGGAAQVMGLASLVIKQKLPVSLRILIPAVENCISGNAFRPGDVINTRKGLTVEINNTDAEGRLILADALAEAASEKPDLILDFATLTGAARIALGTDIPVLFTPNDVLADALIKASSVTQDPLWRLPLYAPYCKLLDSSIADLNNAPNTSYGGAITAALFLQKFVPPDQVWAHIDLMAWNISNRPGRPEGGEAMALRAIWHYLEKYFCKEPV